MSLLERPLLPELEHLIFKCSAISCREKISDLLLVSHQVRYWIEPFRFHSIIFQNPNFDRLIKLLESKAAGWLSQHVHYCCINLGARVMTEEQFTTFNRIIRNFSNLKGLALWSYWPRDTGRINPMPLNFSHFPHLTLLSLCIRTIFWRMEFLPAGILLPITHITWDMDTLSVLETFLRLGRLPNLTHIRASWLSYITSVVESHKSDERSRAMETLIKILQRKQIRCFAIADLESEENILEELIANYPKSEQAKIVLLPDGPIPNVQDWVNTAWGDEDTWARADRGIHERQRIEAL